MSRIREFGRLADGRRADAILIGTPEGLEAEVLTYGAILHRLTFPVAGKRRPLVLSLDALAQYENDPAYVGPVVGRFANRIAGGRFEIDGQAHQLSRNEHGNHLHGGVKGTGKALWRALDTSSANSVRLGLTSPAGEEGYPGTLEVTLDIAIRNDSLHFEFSATSDAATPVNLTCHPYFNLGGDATAHWLRIPASRYLPVGAGLIPMGQLARVDHTPFDFRSSRKLAPPPLHTHPQLAIAGGFDHCWVLDDDADCHCELRSPQQDIALTITGSGPGLQFYSGQYLSRSHPAMGSGLALEPQGLPDAPNHAAFPDLILRHGETYRANIEFRVRLI